MRCEQWTSSMSTDYGTASQRNIAAKVTGMHTSMVGIQFVSAISFRSRFYDVTGLSHHLSITAPLFGRSKQCRTAQCSHGCCGEYLLTPVCLLLTRNSAADLGIGVWSKGGLDAPVIVPVTALCGHFARGEIPYQDRRYWVTMSLCHVSLSSQAHTTR